MTSNNTATEVATAEVATMTEAALINSLRALVDNTDATAKVTTEQVDALCTYARQGQFTMALGAYVTRQRGIAGEAVDASVRALSARMADAPAGSAPAESVRVTLQNLAKAFGMVVESTAPQTAEVVAYAVGIVNSGAAGVEAAKVDLTACQTEATEVLKVARWALARQAARDAAKAARDAAKAAKVKADADAAAKVAAALPGATGAEVDAAAKVDADAKAAEVDAARVIVPDGADTQVTFAEWFGRLRDLAEVVDSEGEGTAPFALTNAQAAAVATVLARIGTAVAVPTEAAPAKATRRKAAAKA